MTSDTTSATTSGKKYLALAILLAVLVLALAIFYYLLTRPPQLSGKQGPRDRNFLFSIYGFEGDLLRRPTGVAVDSKGQIHVADTGKKRVVVFDARGSFVTTYGEMGDKPLQLWDPIGVAVAEDGRSYVLDKTKKKIVIFDALHRAYKAIGFPDWPTSVAVSGKNLFATTASGVVLGDLDGNMQTGYISRGKKAGQFDLPGGVAIGKDGTLYVADSLNYRVQAIQKNGKPKWVYGKPLPPKTAVMYRGPDRKFGLPATIALDDNGKLYVVDGTNSEIVVLDAKTGEFIERMGAQGHDDGQFYYPDGIAYADGRLVIADKFNDRVEVFSVPGGPGPAATLYIPLGLLALLAPLALLLLRRRRKYIGTTDFVAALAKDPQGPVVGEVLKKVLVSPELAARARTLDDISVEWLAQDVPAEQSSEVMARYGISEDEAQALAIALQTKGKRVLLIESDRLAAVAEELEIPTLTYAELRATLGELEEAPAEGEV